MAEAWARTVETNIEQGIVNPNAVFKDTAVNDLLDRYKKEITPRKKGSKQEESKLDLLKSEFQGLNLSALTVERVVQFADKRLRAVKSDTVRRDLSVLSSVLENAKTLWNIPLAINPAQQASQVLTKTRTLKRKVQRVRRITDDELAKLKSELGEQMWALVEFALETAMRRGELANLKWGDIDGNRLTIVEDKTGKTTTIPLSTKAVAILDQIGRGNSEDLVFGRRADSITQAFNRACNRANIDSDLRFHDLRREATSRYFEKGLSIPEVQSITRHSDLRSLQIYTKIALDHVARKLG